MPERMDDADLITNAEVWVAFNRAQAQWDLWKNHVSRKYNIQPTDNYHSDGRIIRNVTVVAENLTPIPDSIKDAWGGDPNKAT